MLHVISPRLASWAYPCLATRRIETALGSLMAVGVVISSRPLLSRHMPMWLTYVSIAVYPPLLHRLLLMDVRVVRLLLRQFETSFLLANWLLGLLCVSRSLFATPLLTFYGYNMLVSAAYVLLLDGVRIEHRAKQQAAVVFASICIFLSGLHVLGLSRYTDYDVMVSDRRTESMHAPMHAADTRSAT